MPAWLRRTAKRIWKRFRSFVQIPARLSACPRVRCSFLLGRCRERIGSPMSSSGTSAVSCSPVPILYVTANGRRDGLLIETHSYSKPTCQVFLPSETYDMVLSNESLPELVKDR